MLLLGDSPFPFTGLSSIREDMGHKLEPYKGKILVINDVPNIRGKLALYLAQMGYYYTFVDSAHEAESLGEHTHFDSVVYSHEFFFPPWSLSF
jgi:PleD family two-component response regulator